MNIYRVRMKCVFKVRSGILRREISKEAMMTQELLVAANNEGEAINKYKHHIQVAKMKADFEKRLRRAYDIQYSYIITSPVLDGMNDRALIHLPSIMQWILYNIRRQEDDTTTQ